MFLSKNRPINYSNDFEFKVVAISTISISNIEFYKKMTQSV